MSDLQTNLSIAPYGDDYNTAKKYYRILFVPSRAVQVRELIQIQSIIQEQVRRFGNHVFKDGSIVDGCNITHVPKLEYVRLDNGYVVSNANNAFDETLQNFLAVSANTGVRASIRLVKQGYQNLYPDTNVFYIDYVKTGRDGSNNEVLTFNSGETLSIYNSTQPKTANTLDPGKLYNTINVFTANTGAGQVSTGQTYAVTVGEGIVYQKGFFVNVGTHTITVADFSTNVDDYLVGFETNESIVNHLQDTSLLDPVNNQSNLAPGADRLKLEPVLVSKLKSSIAVDDDFFPIIEFGSGKPVVQKTDPEYASLGEALDKARHEVNGDFYVKPFLTTTEATANTSEFNYAVSSGVGYVKGTRVELLNTKRITAERATTLDSVNANIVTLNYGYYVYIDELVGTFDYDSFTTVNIYDAAQDSITDLEGSTSAATGNQVGTATIRNVVYDSGSKGTSTGRYRAYISNVVMNSGKTFSTDAKSIYVSAGAFGRAKADLVLEGGKAVIKESSNDSLIFTTGLVGLKRLTDSGGVNDTQYYLRDTATATLQSNGFTTFTLNAPYAGGSERFFASAGALSTANELKVDVVFGADAYTSALTGTVNSTTTGVVLAGTGSTFTTSYNVGDYIRVSANSTSHYIRSIASIANNTSMSLNAAISQANTVAAHSKFFPQGHVLDLGTSGSVNVISNTQFSVSTGLTFASGTPQTLTASYPVLRTQSVSAKKDVKKTRFVKIDCSTGGIIGPWNLGLTDVYSINKVYVGTTYDVNNPNRAAWFTIDNGQKSTHYDHAKLQISPAYSSQITTSTRILVELNYFQANTAAGIGFYSVDSYPARGPGVAANSTNISFTEIPSYKNIDLRDAIDFRPSKFNTAADATTVGAATVNPAVANSSFNVSGSGAYLAEPDSNFQADAEYYLPRIDLLQVNRNGQFNVKSSTPSLKPKTPLADVEAMPIASAYVPPFPSLTSDERSYGSSAQKIQTTLQGNRDYTMRDINALDQRITRVEYYQLLSALETSAKDFAVKDSNGLDRFKNGIFADPFNNHNLGDITNFEYAIAIDQVNSIGRPRVEVNPVDLKVASKVNTYTDGRILSLPYTSELFASQTLASKYRNLTESLWGWDGSMAIFPSYDHYRDDNVLPDINVVLDNTTAWDQFASSPLGSNFGDWRTTSSTSVTSVRTGGASITTTTTNTQTRTVDQLVVGTSLSTQDLGQYIVDITVSPFIRSREVAFICTGLKPNTNYWTYFDRTAVSQHCAPATATSAYNPLTGAVIVESGKESEVVAQSAAWGTQLVSDSNGELLGLFRIPEATFKTGDRELLIANVSDIVAGEDAITSSAKIVYTASSVQTTSRGTNLNVIDPVLSTRSTSQVVTSRTVAVRPATKPDPIGQSWPIDVPDEVPGIFLDKIGLYFKAKDANLGVSVVVCEMLAGFPDTSKILSRSFLKSSQVNVSDDGTVETVFNFTDIPYLSAKQSYAFFVQPDGNSPEYLIWMAEVGGVDIATGFKIFSNPSTGVAFTSSNAQSWNILMTEDVKFNIYRCLFTSYTGTATFTDQSDEYLTVNGFTAANSSTFVQVGDVVYTQNSTGGLLTSNSSPRGVVQLVDYAGDKLVLDGSIGGFAANTVLQIHRPSQSGNVALLNANTLIANTTINTINNIDYSIVVPRLGFVTPFGTNVSVDFKGMDSAEIVDTNFKAIQPEVELELLDKVRTIKSASNRTANSSAIFQANLATSSLWISPIIDLRRKSALFIKNVINNDITNEHTRYGNAVVKYVSGMVTLREGQDAEDIKVLISAHRPINTDVNCYVKFKNAEDYATFEEKLWTRMTIASPGGSVYCSASDPNDYREYEFNLPTVQAQVGEAFANPANLGIIQYVDSAGSVFVGYKNFAIKIVLTSTTSEIVPRIDDVRVICLQV